MYTDDRCTALVKQGGLLIDPVTNGIRKLLSSYARIFNARYEQSGSLFRQKTKASCLSDQPAIATDPLRTQDYYFNCFHYIHQNPYRAGLVERLEDWEYSSFKDYANLREAGICNKELASRFCSYSASDFMKISYKVIPGSMAPHYNCK